MSVLDLQVLPLLQPAEKTHLANGGLTPSNLSVTTCHLG